MRRKIKTQGVNLRGQEFKTSPWGVLNDWRCQRSVTDSWHYTAGILLHPFISTSYWRFRIGPCFL